MGFWLGGYWIFEYNTSAAHEDMEEIIGQSHNKDNEASDVFDFMDIENKDDKEKEEEQTVKMSKVLNVISKVKMFWRFKYEDNLPWSGC